MERSLIESCSPCVYTLFVPGCCVTGEARHSSLRFIEPLGLAGRNRSNHRLRQLTLDGAAPLCVYTLFVPGFCALAGETGHSLSPPRWQQDLLRRLRSRDSSGLKSFAGGDGGCQGGGGGGGGGGWWGMNSASCVERAERRRCFRTRREAGGGPSRSGERPLLSILCGSSYSPPTHPPSLLPAVESGGRRAGQHVLAVGGRGRRERESAPGVGPCPRRRATSRTPSASLCGRPARTLGLTRPGEPQ